MLMKPSVKVVSNTVTGNTRTVTLTRPLAGMTSDYYSFSMTSTDVTTPFISAVGSGAAFAYHKNKAIGTLSFLPANGGACICPEAPKAFGQATGKLTYSKTGQKEDVGTGAVGFRAGKCADLPATSLIEQKNPTCDIRHYRGGQSACHHMWSLLDAEQEIPWADQPLVFSHKWRFWVQPYLEGACHYVASLCYVLTGSFFKNNILLLFLERKNLRALLSSAAKWRAVQSVRSARSTRHLSRSPPFPFPFKFMLTCATSYYMH